MIGIGGFFRFLGSNTPNPNPVDSTHSVTPASPEDNKTVEVVEEVAKKRLLLEGEETAEGEKKGEELAKREWVVVKEKENGEGLVAKENKEVPPLTQQEVIQEIKQLVGEKGASGGFFSRMTKAVGDTVTSYGVGLAKYWVGFSQVDINGLIRNATARMKEALTGKEDSISPESPHYQPFSELRDFFNSFAIKLFNENKEMLVGGKGVLLEELEREKTTIDGLIQLNGSLAFAHLAERIKEETVLDSTYREQNPLKVFLSIVCKQTAQEKLAVAREFSQTRGIKLIEKAIYHLIKQESIQEELSKLKDVSFKVNEETIQARLSELEKICCEEGKNLINTLVLGHEEFHNHLSSKKLLTVLTELKDKSNQEKDFSCEKEKELKECISQIKLELNQSKFKESQYVSAFLKGLNTMQDKIFQFQDLTYKKGDELQKFVEDIKEKFSHADFKDKAPIQSFLNSLSLIKKLSSKVEQSEKREAYLNDLYSNIPVAIQEKRVEIQLIEKIIEKTKADLFLELSIVFKEDIPKQQKLNELALKWHDKNARSQLLGELIDQTIPLSVLVKLKDHLTTLISHEQKIDKPLKELSDSIHEFYKSNPSAQGVLFPKLYALKIAIGQGISSSKERENRFNDFFSTMPADIQALSSELKKNEEEIKGIFVEIADNILKILFPKGINSIVFPGVETASKWVMDFYQFGQTKLASLMFDFYKEVGLSPIRQKGWEAEIKEKWGLKVDFKELIFMVKGPIKGFIEGNATPINLLEQFFDSVSGQETKVLDKQEGGEKTLTEMEKKAQVIARGSQSEMTAWVLNSFQSIFDSTDPHLVDAGLFITEGLNNFILGLLVQGSRLFTSDQPFQLGDNEFVSKLIKWMNEQEKVLKETGVVTEEKIREIIEELAIPSFLHPFVISQISKRLNNLSHFDPHTPSLESIKQMYKNLEQELKSTKEEWEKKGNKIFEFIESSSTWMTSFITEENVKVVTSPLKSFESTENEEIEKKLNQYLPNVSIEPSVLDSLKKKSNALGETADQIQKETIKLVQEWLGVLIKTSVVKVFKDEKLLSLIIGKIAKAIEQQDKKKFADLKKLEAEIDDYTKKKQELEKKILNQEFGDKEQRAALLSIVSLRESQEAAKKYIEQLENDFKQKLSDIQKKVPEFTVADFREIVRFKKVHQKEIDKAKRLTTDCSEVWILNHIKGRLQAEESNAKFEKEKNAIQESIKAADHLIRLLMNSSCSAQDIEEMVDLLHAERILENAKIEKSATDKKINDKLQGVLDHVEKQKIGNAVWGSLSKRVGKIEKYKKQIDENDSAQKLLSNEFHALLGTFKELAKELLEVAGLDRLDQQLSVLGPLSGVKNSIQSKIHSLQSTHLPVILFKHLSTIFGPMIEKVENQEKVKDKTMLDLMGHAVSWFSDETGVKPNFVFQPTQNESNQSAPGTPVKLNIPVELNIPDLCKRIAQDLIVKIPDLVGDYEQEARLIWATLSPEGQEPSLIQLTRLKEEITALQSREDQPATHKDLVNAYAKVAEISLTVEEKNKAKDLLRAKRAMIKDKISQVLLSPQTAGEIASAWLSRELASSLSPLLKSLFKNKETLVKTILGIPESKKLVENAIEASLLKVLNPILEGQGLEKVQEVIKNNPDYISELIMTQLSTFFNQYETSINHVQGAETLVAIKTLLGIDVGVPNDPSEGSTIDKLPEHIGRLVVDATVYLLNQSKEGKRQGAVLIPQLIKDLAEQLKGNKLGEAAEFLLKSIEDPNFEKFLTENLPSLLHGREEEKKHLGKLIGNFSLIPLHSFLDRFVNTELSQNVVKECVSCLVEEFQIRKEAEAIAKKQDRKVTYADFISAAEKKGVLHSALPKGPVDYQVYYEQKRQFFLANLSKKLLKASFPNGRKDLHSLPALSRDIAWKFLKKTAMPLLINECMALLLDQDMMTNLAITSIENFRDSMNGPVVLNQPPIADTTGGNLDEECGKLIEEIVDITKLPESVAKMLKAKENGRSVYGPMLGASLRSMLTKEFKVSVMKTTLEKFGGSDPETGVPFLKFDMRDESVKNQERLQNREPTEKRLHRVVKECFEAGVGRTRREKIQGWWNRLITKLSPNISNEKKARINKTFEKVVICAIGTFLKIALYPIIWIAKRIAYLVYLDRKLKENTNAVMGRLREPLEGQPDFVEHPLHHEHLIYKASAKVVA